MARSRLSTTSDGRQSRHFHHSGRPSSILLCSCPSSSSSSSILSRFQLLHSTFRNGRLLSSTRPSLPFHLSIGLDFRPSFRLLHRRRILLFKPLPNPFNLHLRFSESKPLRRHDTLQRSRLTSSSSRTLPSLPKRFNHSRSDS